MCLWQASDLDETELKRAENRDWSLVLKKLPREKFSLCHPLVCNPGMPPGKEITTLGIQIPNPKHQSTVGWLWLHKTPSLWLVKRTPLRNKGLLRPYSGKPMFKKPLYKKALFIGVGGTLRGVGWPAMIWGLIAKNNQEICWNARWTTKKNLLLSVILVG